MPPRTTRKSSGRADHALVLALILAGLVVIVVLGWLVGSGGRGPAAPSHPDAHPAAGALPEAKALDASRGPAPSRAAPTPAPLVSPDLRFRGRVLDPDGVPRGGARVIAEWHDGRLGGRRRTVVRSRADGRFVVLLHGAPGTAEPVRLQASAAGSVASKVVEILREAAASEIRLQLRRGGRITLRAVRAEDGTPLPKAEVRVRRAGAAPQAEVVAPVLTDRTGRATVGPLPDGRYDLRIRALGRLPARRDEVPVRAAGATGAVGPTGTAGDGDLDLGDLPLALGCFVSGTAIEAASGTPLADVLVRAIDTDAPEVSEERELRPRARSDARGRFRLGPLPITDGKLSIHLVKPGFALAQLEAHGCAASNADDWLGAVALRRMPTNSTRHAEEATEDADVIGLAGPGIGLRRTTGGTVVAVVVPGSPADEAGIRKGEHVVRVDGLPLRDVSPRAAVQLLHGAPGTSVSVEIRNQGEADGRTLRLLRR